jgi:hypothetical protein
MTAKYCCENEHQSDLNTGLSRPKCYVETSLTALHLNLSFCYEIHC